MSYIVKLRAVYERGEFSDSDYLDRVRELVAARAPAAQWETTEGEEVRDILTVEVDYGASSRHGAVSAAARTLDSLFDEIATDDYYQPWPDILEIEVIGP